MFCVEVVSRVSSIHDYGPPNSRIPPGKTLQTVPLVSIGGSSHEVPHPEFAWVFGSTVFVGVAAKSTKAPEDFVKQISVLHVTRIEHIPTAETK